MLQDNIVIILALKTSRHKAFKNEMMCCAGTTIN